MTMFRENLYTGDALERNWKHSPAVMEYCTSRWVLYCTVLYCTECTVLYCTVLYTY